eukprot:CAMPEP_0113910198 /NCGR_PEP_ID=MMETSP0780_2-20120614/27367_1 /TAXON_ID=652834 /ORGANISM="Palpitomonas bilix" /LENGTH=179 /DNA_ID=CAMNT_0000906277 /DNA_START=140 /DNA_END=679 /DNA_ORIENTATION=+ /assembly_acc=CAM_ASM_000599
MTVQSNLITGLIDANQTLNQSLVNCSGEGSIATGGVLGNVTFFNIGLAVLGFFVVLVAISGFISCGKKSAGCFCCYSLFLLILVLAEVTVVVVYFAVPEVFSKVLDILFNCAGQQGFDVIAALLRDYAHVAPYVAIGIAASQVLAIVFAFCARSEVRRLKDKEAGEGDDWLDRLRKTKA